MALVTLQDIYLSYGQPALIDGVNLSIERSERVCLIGRNGAGKSTLLNILTGKIIPDDGVVKTTDGVKIAQLEQAVPTDTQGSVYEVIAYGLGKEGELAQSYHRLSAEVANNPTQKNMAELEACQAELDLVDGWDVNSRVEAIITKMGLNANTDIADLSGGYKRRVLLARALVSEPDLLVLDEPTNHLDIESIIWLEQFLKNYSGAVVIVSHDKMFLNHVTNRTIEIVLGQIYDMPKPYSQYLTLRAEQKALQIAAQKNQQKQIEYTEKLIEKFRAKASKATMAQSLIKKLDKIERIRVDEDDNTVMSVRFPISVNPGKVVLETQSVSKSYGDLEVLKNIDFTLERGQKIAFVGQNGQGKSTLAKILVGELSAVGSVKLGHNVQLGYFAQNQAEYLDGKKTVLNTMIDAANETNRSKVRDILGSFLFRGEAVDKYVSVLSGGERNRLALAKLLLQPLNVLVMDEPTNHLDIQSKNVLKSALQNFEGTLILVSHDREFLQGLNDVVYEFKDRKIKPYLGDINFYLEQRQLQNLRDAERRTPEKITQKTSDNKRSYESQKKLKSLQNRLCKHEAAISALEKEIKAIDLELEINYEATVATSNFFDTYQAKKAELESLMQQWETLTKTIENHS